MKPNYKRPKILDISLTEKQVTSGVLDAAKMFGFELKRNNVGMATGASGRPVRFGESGDTDWRDTVPMGPNRGRTVGVEIKRENFDPAKLKGDKRAHFDRQLHKMKYLNERGGIAFWVQDARDAARVFQLIAMEPGLKIEIDAIGFCTMIYG